MAFIDTGLVALRESLEGLLILGILLGIATKTGQPGARRPILWGALAGLLISGLAGWLAQGVSKEMYDRNEALFEGLAALVAVLILTYMVVWMYRHTQGMMGALHRRTKEALAGGRGGILFGLGLIAILREGVETVLFVAARSQTDGAATTALALMAGIAASAFVAFLVFSGFLKMSIERFMAATGLVLVVIAAGVTVTAVHELSEPKEEGGPAWFPESPVAWDLSANVPTECEAGAPATTACTTGGVLHAVLGYRADPRWAEVATYLLYLGVMATYVILRLRKPHGHDAAH
ncbi:MAG: FTR1 family protein [bacterium]